MPNSVMDFPWEFGHIDGTLLVKTGPGALHTICINGLTTAGDCTVYDGLDNTGTVIAVLHIDPTTSISVQPVPMIYDCKLETGLYVEYDGTLVADLTATFI